MKDDLGWMIFRKDGEKLIAHVAAAGPCGTRFIPMFATKKAAAEYRDFRLQIPGLKIKRIRVTLVVV